METFFIAFVHRALSGLQNGLGYARQTLWLYVLAGVLMFYPYVVIKNQWSAHFVFVVFNIIVVFMKTASFERTGFMERYKDIHLWEYLVTGGFFLWMMLMGRNMLMLFCSVYPAMILHKGFINLGSGLDFFAHTTDDDTGKTYGIPLLGIKVPRTDTRTRLIMAGVSIVAALIIWHMKWGIYLRLQGF